MEGSTIDFEKELSPQELLELSMIDRIKYVVDRFFSESGFSAMDIARKLNELHPDPGAAYYTPIEVHTELVAYYGDPNE